MKTVHNILFLLFYNPNTIAFKVLFKVIHKEEIFLFGGGIVVFISFDGHMWF